MNIFRTYNLVTALSVCTDLLERKGVSVIYGKGGLGKSTALQFFAASNSNTVYVQFKPEEVTLQSFYNEILLKVGARELKSDGIRENCFCSELIPRLMEKRLRLIILDSFPIGSEDLIYQLIYLQEQIGNTHISVMISCSDQFPKRTIMKRCKKQIALKFIRSARFTEFMKLSKDEVRAICKYHGVDDYMPVYLEAKTFTDVNNAIKGT